MKQPIKIIEPEIKILKSGSSSLGNINCFMVVFDKTVFSAEKYRNLDERFKENENCISDKIREDDFEYPIYVLHSASIGKSNDITPLVKKEPNTKQFSTNTANCDTTPIEHCIAIRETFDLVYVKSGFHYWYVCDPKGNDTPYSWDSMSRIYGGEYSFLSVDRIRFWSIYQSALKIWTEQETNERAVKAKERFERYEQSISK